MKVAQFDVHIVIKDSEGEIKTFDYKDTPLSKVGNLTLPASWTIQSISAKRIPKHII
tara:strand:- start:839 stop:1009 length:171 start_codon:yes stop_codon:yes gene_type:complete